MDGFHRGLGGGLIGDVESANTISIQTFQRLSDEDKFQKFISMSQKINTLKRKVMELQRSQNSQVQMMHLRNGGLGAITKQGGQCHSCRDIQHKIDVCIRESNLKII